MASFLSYNILVALGIVYATGTAIAEPTQNKSSDRHPRYSINWQPTSQPLLFAHDDYLDHESHEVNSKFIIRKKKPASSVFEDYTVHEEGPTFYKGPNKDEQEDPHLVNNHQADDDNPLDRLVGGGVVWKPNNPQKPAIAAISNHKTKDGESYTKKPDSENNVWSEKKFSSSWSKDPVKTISGHYRPTFDLKPSVTVGKRPPAPLNNHNPWNNWLRPKPTMASEVGHPFTAISVVQNVHSAALPAVSSDRLKAPDKVVSNSMTVYDAPTGMTTIKHKNLIVIKKPSHHTDLETQQSQVGIVTSKPIVTLGDTIKGNKHNYSIAAVLDPWANIPIPSKPSWASSSSNNRPIKGGSSTASSTSTSSSQGSASMFPGFPVMPFLTQLISPLLKRPLSQNAVNTGIQGIKAMQGFLRNSLIGAMLCFLPSALIAISLSATQRAEVREMPEMDRMMVFCRTCLDNLKTIKKMARNEPDWWETMNKDLFDK